jgi:ribosome-associated heat shock protein Hsp15
VETGSVRVDSWLWAVRVYKTRSAATAACRAGHVRVGGSNAKASQAIRVGDEVRVRIAGFDRTFVVSRLIVKRVGAPDAQTAYEETTPPPPPREERPVTPVRDRGAGRPTKRERRDLEKLRAR